MKRKTLRLRVLLFLSALALGIGALPFNAGELSAVSFPIIEGGGEGIVLYLADGNQIELESESALEKYLESIEQEIVGLWLAAPELSTTDFMPQTFSALERGRVLVILVDGLSFYHLRDLQPPFLAKKEVAPARTVMPSITPVALATILTGKLPSEHGVSSRRVRQPAVDDLFSHAAHMGKSSVLVEGPTKVINTSSEQILNPDLNGNGSTDDEVFAAAQGQVEAGVDLIFVHFHGYDDQAHTFGPTSSEAEAKLRELDLYVQQLCEQFSGTVFVLADHGQHPSTGEKLGEHGEFHHLDLTVPWISWEQSGI